MSGSMFCACATGSCPYPPSRVFWPEVTSVTWLEEALSGSRFCACSTGSCTISTLAGPFDRKWPCPEAVMTGSRFCACPAFFLVVVPWLPKVTWVCACATGSCATPVMTEGHVTPSEVSLGCSLRRPRPIFSMVTGTSHPRPDSFFPSYPLRVYNWQSQQRSFYRHRFLWYRGSSENQFMECCIKW